MRTITISLRAIILFVILASLVVGAALLWPRLGQAGADGKTPAWAAEESVRAFYAADYRDRDAWLATLRPLSTDDGYALLEMAVAPAVWPSLEAAKTIARPDQVDVEDRGLIQEGESESGGPWQIRQVSVRITPDALWPKMPSGEFIARVLLGQQDGEWRFASFLTEAQVEIFTEARP